MGLGCTKRWALPRHSPAILPPGLGPGADQALALRWGYACGGWTMSAVLHLFVAAATEEEVGCLWS